MHKGFQFAESLGADATFNHRLPLDEQLKEIASIAGGKFSRIFDASALTCPRRRN
jgi:hypothetical protein